MFIYDSYEPGSARTDNIDTSKDAAKFNTKGLQQEVYAVIKSFGEFGCISDDVVAQFKQYKEHTITPRYAQLIKKGLIVDTGLRRIGTCGHKQRVMKAI